jgi:hypothetical protein
MIDTPSLGEQLQLAIIEVEKLRKENERLKQQLDAARRLGPIKVYPPEHDPYYENQD